ncbi:MAG: SDR family oxidoreductase [bacterium]
MEKGTRGAALITGAGRGIGAAVARKLAADGFKIVVNYHESQDEAESVVADIKEAGGDAFAHRADVRRPDETAAMAEAACRRFGKIDVLVNNATSPISHSTFDNLEWSDVEEQIDIHLKAVFNACKVVLPNMVDNERGRIINITTVYADNVPPARMHGYVIAKSALQALTKTLAVEYGPKGITVNNVAPGMTETSFIADVPDKAKMVTSMQTPLRRLAQPQDVAAAVAFLAGDDASYITGETVRVCGGQIML